MRASDFSPNDAVTELLLHLVMEDANCLAAIKSLPIPNAFEERCLTSEHNREELSSE